MTTQPAWKQSLRADAEAFLRSSPTDLFWVLCTFCGEGVLESRTLFEIEGAAAGRWKLGTVCDDCKA